MNSSIYSRLAVTNLKNNRKTYFPYILTGVLTVMMFYIMDALAGSKSLGRGTLTEVLHYAVGVIVVFSVIFLFYTNSFLIKQRKRELGVYNILGMGKPHISRMLMLESLITGGVSIIGGIAAGILFSKLMFLALLKILHYDVGMEFEISAEAVRDTLILFLVIFTLTLVYNLIQIRLTDPIQLLRGSSQGEREPKTKALIALAGFLLLGAGYGISLSVESPLAAIATFFLAVIFVILGTYALFIAGSIVVLKAMRKNKGYYYQAKHFASVSGMIYRMKQNAVGLANICILSTMVLVMVSSTASLYMGIDDIMKYRFPTDVDITMEDTDQETEDMLLRAIENETAPYGVSIDPDTCLSYHEGSLAGILKKDELSLKELGNYALEDAREIYLMPLEDYNQMEGKHSTLASDEVIVYTTGGMYGYDSIIINGKDYQVKEEPEEIRAEKKNQSRVLEAMYIVMTEETQIRQIMDEIYANSDMQEEWLQAMNTITYHLKFDLKGDSEACEKIENTLEESVMDQVPGAFCETKENKWEEVYTLYGGLLFIGIYLGMMFLMATVLIIYYKQISEGYEDKERYQIMQKVGMDQREVKRSIRSQVVTVFFLPLVMAVLHIVVAFQVIEKILVTLGFVNSTLFLICTAVSIAIFAIFYGIVYMLTAKEYYRIVRW